MARPYKSGLEYFSFDVDFFEDEKVTAISVEFGITGEIIAIRLLCAIYRNGYFAKWDTPLKMKLAKSSGIKPNVIEEVVNRLVKWNFFDEFMFKSFGVLTSVGIQKRYLESTRRRFGVISDYCLLKPHTNRVITDNNQVIVDNNPINDGNNAQSKVKESKVKESRERELSSSNRAKADAKPPDALSLQFLAEFESEFPLVNHLEEFQKCRDYYLARNMKIEHWGPLYRNWLRRDFPKVMKPNRKPPVEFPPECEVARPEEVQAAIHQAKAILKNGGDNCAKIHGNQRDFQT